MDAERVAMGAGVALVGAAAVLAVGAARPIAEPAALPAAAPNQLVADGVRYAVGLPGDVVVVADWSCTQQATAAVLRPSTGALFVFDAWAVSGAPTTARPVDADPGAVDLSPGASCGRAELVHPDGTRHPVDTAP